MDSRLRMTAVSPDNWFTIWTRPVRGISTLLSVKRDIALGILFIGATFASAQGWDLLTVAIYAFLRWHVAIAIIMNLGFDTATITLLHWLHPHGLRWYLCCTDFITEKLTAPGGRSEQLS